MNNVETTTVSPPELQDENTEVISAEKIADQEQPVQTESNPPEEAKRTGLKEIRRRQKLRSAIKPFYVMHESGQFDDAEIVDFTRDWAEQNATSEENLPETLNYFDLATEIIDEKFSPDEKAEIVCALAEMVSGGVIKAEALQALAYRVVRGGPSNNRDVLCRYHRGEGYIIIYDEMFAKNNGGEKQNIVAIMAHEIGHGSNDFSDTLESEEAEGQVGVIVEDAENRKREETFWLSRAIEKYLQVKSREGASEAEVEKMRRWLTKEIKAEKIGAYLRSGGEFRGFLAALWEEIPDESRKQLKGQRRFSWVKEQKFFFDQIKETMGDKEAFLAAVTESTKIAREKAGQKPKDEELDWDEYDGDFYVDGQLPDNLGSNQQQEQGGEPGGGEGGFWSGFGNMMDAASELGNTVAVSEINKPAKAA